MRRHLPRDEVENKDFRPETAMLDQIAVCKYTLMIFFIRDSETLHTCMGETKHGSAASSPH